MASFLKIQRFHLSCAPTDETEGQIHPLLIDHVVEKIFGYIWNSSNSGRSEVLRCREVCKLWKEKGSNVYKKLDHFSSFGPYFSCEDPQRGIERFVRIMSQPDEILFPKYKIKYRQIYENPAIFQKFLEKFNPFVHQLEIGDVQDVIITYASLFLQIDLKRLNLSNLKDICFYFEYPPLYMSLTPKQNSIYELREGSNVIEDLLKAAPNLQILTIEKSYTYNFIPLQVILGNSILPNLSKSVQDLRLILTMEDDNWRKLRTLGLRLTAMEFAIGAESSMESYTNFIDDQKETLIELKVHSRYFSKILELPICCNLKVLEITGEEGYEEFLPFVKTFAFPSLKNLRILVHYLNPSEDASDLKSGTFNASVEDLDMPYIIANSALIHKILKSFPNLKKLRIYLETKEEWEKILASFSTKVQNMEEVHISYRFPPELNGSVRSMQKKYEFKYFSERIGKTIVYHERQPQLRPTEN